MDVNDLRFSYHNKPVLDGVSLSIVRGEVIGILGPNGCGKTTLLKNLNKNLSPHGGCIMMDGTDLKDMTKKDIARNVAVVPQTNEIRFAFSVREIVSMGRMPFISSFSGESKEDIEIIENAMERTGISEFMDRQINTMSGGERQRVIIARALAQTPSILLMDEPTLHLDISTQFDVLDLAKKLSEEDGLTVVIVSHDLPMIARYCDRIVMLKDHKIFAIGTPEEVLTPDNMKAVFNVDAVLDKDGRTGNNIVRIFGSCTNK
ncbi:MAG: ABC transporter ATP-binding protein [Methanomassiliicoccaceae archaeon]|nr:ABC transporter ATP-binding protein [Methanomassiliicoccaceae archaeon]